MNIDFSRAPRSSRRKTLVRALQTLEEVRDDGEASLIVEVGTSRTTHALGSSLDGWSTRVFGWYLAQVGGILHTIDVSAEAIRAAREVCEAYRDRITFHVSPAEEVLPRFDRIDLLYMDAGNDPESYLEMWSALACSPRLVLFDDIADCETFAGKGRALVPHLLGSGYSLEFCGLFQALVSRDA